MSRPVVRCPTGKTGFTESVALAKLEEYSTQENSRYHRPTRIYYHDLCDSFHLTSDPS